MNRTISNSLQLFVALFLLLNLAHSQNYDLDNSLTVFWPAPNMAMPNYLQDSIDPTFGTTLTRITGDVGASIPNIQGETWRNVARHGYATRQPWNADESLLYLGKHSNLNSSSGPDLFLDGNTYEVIKQANLPSGNEHRWHQTDPELFLVIRDTEIITWNYNTEIITQLISYSGYSNVELGGTGNFTNDGKKVAVSGIRNSDNKLVVFILDIENQTKGTDIDISEINALDYVSISSKGNYIIVVGTYASGGDRTKVYDSIGNQVGFWDEYGMPSHFDLATDVNGDEVAVGVSKSDSQQGKLIKRRLSDGLVTELTTGGWPPHTSARAINRPGWVFASTSASANYSPYMREIIAVKLDGSRIERIAHTRNVLEHYLNETHACPSPSGSRVIFASDWGSGSTPIQGFIADFRHLLINNVPNANAGPDQNICEGSSTTLSALGGESYLWSTGETTQSIIVNPNTTTTYTVVVSNDSSSNSDDVTVTVNPNPEVNVSEDATILEGNYITLSASGANTYEWSNGAVLPNIAVNPTVTTTYSVTGYINNCYDVSNVTVSVVEQVHVNAGEDKSMCLGEEITLTATGSGADDYLWNTGETTQSITVSPDQDTQFTVLASNLLDSDSDDIFVTVNSCEDDIVFENNTFVFDVYTNSRSSNRIINIKILGLEELCELNLFDTSGKLIHTDKFNMNEGEETIRSINTSLITDGVYIIKIKDENEVHSKSLVIR